MAAVRCKEARAAPRRSSVFKTMKDWDCINRKHIVASRWSLKQWVFMIILALFFHEFSWDLGRRSTQLPSKSSIEGDCSEMGSIGSDEEEGTAQVISRLKKKPSKFDPSTPCLMMVGYATSITNQHIYCTSIESASKYNHTSFWNQHNPTNQNPHLILLLVALASIRCVSGFGICRNSGEWTKTAMAPWVEGCAAVAQWVTFRVIGSLGWRGNAPCPVVPSKSKKVIWAVDGNLHLQWEKKHYKHEHPRLRPFKMTSVYIYIYALVRGHKLWNDTK